ncbi:hypothetical protein ALP68_101204 [Pseudomonas ficuserectae]|nr:hypothetical protein ALQ46_101158 [Pseudomonas savastanoi pv. phaseolicola]RMS33325.1 hypothetical protein ALP68_101204 [Pseudomonas ficuserectae]
MLPIRLGRSGAQVRDKGAMRGRSYGKANASCYMENASDSLADRPELIRLLKDSR